MRSPNWMKAALAAAWFAAATACAADPASSDAGNPVIELKVGRLTIFVKSSAYLRFVLEDKSRIAVTDTAGFLWPLVATDVHGRFYIGNRVVDSESGRVKSAGAIVLGPHYTVLADDAMRVVKIVHGGRVCEVGIATLGFDPADTRASELLHRALRFVDADGPLVGLVTGKRGKPRDFRPGNDSADAAGVLDSA